MTDPTQLHRMLAILLDNALKYSDEGDPVELKLSREDGHAVVSVTDRGCGIPEAEIPHIFDRFYRAQGLLPRRRNRPRARSRARDH